MLKDVSFLKFLEARWKLGLLAQKKLIYQFIFSFWNDLLGYFPSYSYLITVVGKKEFQKMRNSFHLNFRKKPQAKFRRNKILSSEHETLDNGREETMKLVPRCGSKHVKVS